MTPEEIKKLTELMGEAYTLYQNAPDEVKKSLPWKMGRQKQSHTKVKAAFIQAVHERGSLTFPEAKELGIIPRDMPGDTFRKSIVKDSGLIKQVVKKGVPVIYHTKDNERKEVKKFTEANEEAAKSVVPLFNGYTSVDALKVMDESGRYDFVKDLEKDKSKLLQFLDLIYEHSIKEGWELNSTTLRFTKRQEVSQ